MADKVYALYQENKEEPINKNYLYDVFDEMLIKELELKKYVEDIFIINSDDDTLGHYSPETHRIFINQSLLQKVPVNSAFLAIEIIRHELEHARNLKTLYEGKKDIESLIVYYSLRYYAIEHGLDYYPDVDKRDPNHLFALSKEHYHLNPGERLVEIKAWSYMVNMLKNQRTSDDLLKARTMLYYSFIRGYKDNRYYLDPPTYEFLLKTGMYQHYKWLKDQVDKKNYSFDTRIKYGLPVTQREYNKEALEKAKIKMIRDERKNRR